MKKSFDMFFITRPAELSSTLHGTPLQFSPEILTFISPNFFEDLVIVTMSSKASRPRPNTSKPGPKLAVEHCARCCA